MSHQQRDNCMFEWLADLKANLPKQEVKEISVKELEDLDDSDIILINTKTA